MPGARRPSLVAGLAARQPTLRALFMTGHDRNLALPRQDRNLALPRQYSVVREPVDGNDLLAAIRASLDRTLDRRALRGSGGHATRHRFSVVAA